MPTPTTSLTIRKTLPCRPDVAFRAWTEPAQFKGWFAPDPTMKTVAEVDLRRGGKYRIGFQPAGGKPTMFVGGEFLVIDPPRRLEYTWIWEKETDPDWKDQTLVKIDFNPVGTDATELVLTHERFSSAESSQHHQQGWTAITDRMAAAVAQKPGEKASR
jgi:uncharacterized protein YndB with AHSA1/START domain